MKKLTEEQTKRMGEIYEKFKLDLKDADIDETDWDIFSTKEDKPAEEVQAKNQISFTSAGIEIISDECLTDIKDVMILLMDKFRKIIPSYFG